MNKLFSSLLLAKKKKKPMNKLFSSLLSMKKQKLLIHHLMSFTISLIVLKLLQMNKRNIRFLIFCHVGKYKKNLPSIFYHGTWYTNLITTVALKTAFSASRALIKLRCLIATKHDVNLQLSEWPIWYIWHNSRLRKKTLI